MAGIKNYQEKVKQLIDQLYQPADVTDYHVKMSTAQMYENLCTILPARAFDEYDVVEALEELNFFPGYEQKKETLEDAEGNKTEKVYDDLTYFWYLKKKS